MEKDIRYTECLGCVCHTCEHRENCIHNACSSFKPTNACVKYECEHYEWDGD